MPAWDYAGMVDISLQFVLLTENVYLVTLKIKQ